MSLAKEAVCLAVRQRAFRINARLFKSGQRARLKKLKGEG